MPSGTRSRRWTVVLIVSAGILLLGAGVLVGRLIGGPDVSTSFAETRSSDGAADGTAADGTAAAVPGTPAAQATATSGTLSSSPRPARADQAVSVTYAEYDPDTQTVQVGAYVAELVETGGTCAVELAQGARTARAEAGSVPDAAATSCADLAVPLAEIGSGTWNGFVTYDSPTTTGRSVDFVVVIP